MRMRMFTTLTFDVSAVVLVRRGERYSTHRIYTYAQQQGTNLSSFLYRFSKVNDPLLCLFMI